MSEQRPPDDGSGPSAPDPYGAPDDPTAHGAPPQHGAPQYGAPQLGAPQYGAPPQYGGAPQYGSPQYGAPQYGTPYGYGPPQYEHPQGTTVLILGILGIVACQILAPFAWVIGNRALAEIDANPGAYSNRGLVVAGRICGIVGSVLLGLYLAFVLVYFFIIVVAIGSSAA